MLFINCEITSCDIFNFPTKIEITIIVIPILNDWPASLIVFVVADATPRNFFSTEPMMTFIFGDENIPKPVPRIIAINIIAINGVAGLRKNINASPRTKIAMPKVANLRASIMSDHCPASGE